MTAKLDTLHSDLNYFTMLWGGRSAGAVSHSPEIWDKRALEWIEELSSDSTWAQNMNRRIIATSEYLRARGLLGSHDAVIDIGCGPGLFVMEFAKTAKHAAGLDYSKCFISYAEDTAARLDIHNTSFNIRNFLELDIEREGFTGAFDLVFSSNSPAVSAKGSLDKIIAMSSAYCFNTSIIHAKDSLLDLISLDVFGEPYRSRWDGGGFYAMLNLLWLLGYYPETTYYSEVSEETVTLDIESAADYAKLCGHATPDDASRVLRYLESADETSRRIEYRYGSILWDVRVRDARREDS